MKIKNKNLLIISVLIPILIGALSALLSGDMSNYGFNKPSFSPPPFIFPIVWTVLYILMGISSYMIYLSDNKNKGKALAIYAAQLCFNFFWSIIFFDFSQYLLAFVWLIVLIILIIIMIYQFYIIKPFAAYLQIPYLIWCIFAAFLNYMVYKLN